MKPRPNNAPKLEKCDYSKGRVSKNTTYKWFIYNHKTTIGKVLGNPKDKTELENQGIYSISRIIANFPDYKAS